MLCLAQGIGYDTRQIHLHHCHASECGQIPCSIVPACRGPSRSLCRLEKTLLPCHESQQCCMWCPDAGERQSHQSLVDPASLLLCGHLHPRSCTACGLPSRANVCPQVDLLVLLTGASNSFLVPTLLNKKAAASVTSTIMREHQSTLLPHDHKRTPTGPECRQCMISLGAGDLLVEFLWGKPLGFSQMLTQRVLGLQTFSHSCTIILPGDLHVTR